MSDLIARLLGIANRPPFGSARVRDIAAESGTALAAKDAEIKRLTELLGRSEVSCMVHATGEAEALAEIATLRARLAAAEAVMEAARRVKTEDERLPSRGPIGPWVHFAGALAAYDATKEASAEQTSLTVPQQRTLDKALRRSVKFVGGAEAEAKKTDDV